VNGAAGQRAAIDVSSRPVVCILTCDCFDGWLEEIGVSVDSFCEEMMGSWWFNYMQALESFGAALGRVIDDAAFASALGERARRRVEAVFSMDPIGKKLKSFFFPGG
jgi:hypothetical protein